MKRVYTCLLMVASAASVLLAMVPFGPAHADPVEGLVTFSAGTTARADEVNGNFSEVADSVNDNDARVVILEEDFTALCAELNSEITGHTTIHPVEFHPQRSTTEHERDLINNGRFCNSGYPWFTGVFEGLPQGARLTKFQFWTFDSSSDESILGIALQNCNQDLAPPDVTILASYGSFGSGGFQTSAEMDLNWPDIDGRCTYSVFYRLDGEESDSCSEGNSLQIVGARATWIRRPSPAVAAVCGID